jgi:type I restriction enzyme S subunit
MEPIFNQIISNMIESRRLAELRDTLLPKLMSGELNVNDVSL